MEEKRDLPLHVLQEIFHYPEFRNNQRAVIENILQGKNTLAIMPTGAGKSLCFQIPALIFPGITVVISPLIALMKDQVDNLKKRGIYNTAFLNSSLTETEQSEVYSKLQKNQIKILYLAPETLLNTRIINILKSSKISLFAIDEAHCISTWGHDFRPDYLKVKEIFQELNNPPVLALTATANEKVEKDILNQLGVSMDLFKDSFDRKNLFLSIVKIKPGQKKDFLIKDILKKVDGPTIIYVNFIKTCTELSQSLKEQGFSCEHYNGSLESQKRKEVQENFIHDKTKIIVATNAFGMGIDKSDIRLIIHYDVPKSIENYYQETGRAGRDGRKSHCVLLYSQEDSIRLKKFIRSSPLERDEIKSLTKYLENNSGKTIYLNQKSLAQELSLDDVSFKLLLHYLEHLSLIKVHNRIFRRVLFKEISPILPLEYQNIFSSHYFEKNKNSWIDLDEISKITQIPISNLSSTLHNLKSQGLIDFTEGDTVNPLEISNSIKYANLREIEQLFNKLVTANIYKLKDVLNYIDYSGCKKKFILNYFGESANNSCNLCNSCDPAILELTSLSYPKSALTEKDLSLLRFHKDGELGSRVKSTFIILESVQELDAREVHIGKTTLADFLKGSKSKRIFQQYLNREKSYSKLAHLSSKEISSIISYLTKEGYLTIIDADSQFPRPLIYLTEHGEMILNERKKLPSTKSSP